MANQNIPEPQLKTLAQSVKYSVDMMQSSIVKMMDMVDQRNAASWTQAPPPEHRPPLTVTTASPVQVIRIPAGRHETGVRNNFDQTTFNALIESFLTHARRMYEFLMDEPKDDDGSASQFVADLSKWKAARVEQGAALLGMKRPINKHHSHFTYEATREGKKPWALEGDLRNILAVYDVFLENVPPDRKAWFTAPR